MTQKLNLNLKKSYIYLKKQCFTFMYMILLTSLINVGCASNNLSQNQAQQKVTQNTSIEKPALNTKNQEQNLTQKPEEMPLIRQLFYFGNLIIGSLITGVIIASVYFLLNGLDEYENLNKMLSSNKLFTYLFSSPTYIWVLSRIWHEANPHAEKQWDKIIRTTILILAKNFGRSKSREKLSKQFLSYSTVISLCFYVFDFLLELWFFRSFWRQAKTANPKKLKTDGETLKDCVLVNKESEGTTQYHCSSTN